MSSSTIPLTSQQVAQMVVVRASGLLFDHQIQYPAWEPPIATLQHWVENLGVGGVILLGGSAAEVALKTQQLQAWAQTPLLICADVEEGVGQRFSGATWFAPPMAIAAIAQQDLAKACQYAEQMGQITARESVAIGLNWILAPIVDVNNNPQNPVINVRAFGDDPAIVSALTTAFIRGAQSQPVLTTAKHFPGHGDTAVDSHLELPVLSHDRSRLSEVEWPPFQAAIGAGVDTVMSAHLKIPALDDQYPATLSPQVLTGELRQNLHFEGLIVTDALIMGAIADRYGSEEACLLAIEAGADILLMPARPEVAIQAVCQAVESGRIAPERIQASIARIAQAKAKVFPQGQPLTQSPAISDQTASLTQHLSQPAARTTQTAILRDSMRIHSPAASQLSRSVASGRNMIIVDSTIGCDFLGRTAPAIGVPAQFGFSELQIVDAHNPFPASLAATTQIPSMPTLLQLFIRGNPFRGSAGVTQTATAWFEFLLRTEQLQALMIYGSPYVIEPFIRQLPPELPYGFSYGQMPAAQAIALNRLLAGESLEAEQLADRVFC